MVSCLSSFRSPDRLYGESLEVARGRMSGVIIDMQLFEGNLYFCLISHFLVGVKVGIAWLRVQPQHSARNKLPVYI